MSNKSVSASSYSELFDLIGELAHKRFRMAERALIVLGLNHSEARLISVLAQQGSMTQDALSATLTIDRSNAGRSLKKMESRGYIIRTKDELDKRTNVVAITDAGRKVAVEVDAVRDSLVSALFQDLAEEDAEVIVDLLRRAFPER